MSLYKGELVMLKIRQNKEFRPLGGLVKTHLTLNNQLLEASNTESGSWRKLQDATGVRHLSISGQGISTNSESERKLMEQAFSNKASYYQISFESGDCIEGLFQVASYERVGNYQDLENYSLHLESAGEIRYTSKRRKCYG